MFDKARQQATQEIAMSLIFFKRQLEKMTDSQNSMIKTSLMGMHKIFSAKVREFNIKTQVFVMSNCKQCINRWGFIAEALNAVRDDKNKKEILQAIQEPNEYERGKNVVKTVGGLSAIFVLSLILYRLNMLDFKELQRNNREEIIIAIAVIFAVLTVAHQGAKLAGRLVEGVYAANTLFGGDSGDALLKSIEETKKLVCESVTSATDNTNVNNNDDNRHPYSYF